MADPFKLGCTCGFSTEDPHAYLDHMLTTRHVEIPAGEEDAALAELVQAFAMIQRVGDNPDAELPDGMEIRRISREDILADDELSDEGRQQILQRLDEIEKLKKD